MRISRYLDTKTFCDEAQKLKVVNGQVNDTVLDRLERQRLLFPRLRLHYPDEIERRWWADAHPEFKAGGALEPDGPRWEAACSLEEARRKYRWEIDPTVVPHPLDDAEDHFLQFIERPANLPFTPWQNYRISLNAEDDESRYKYDTVVTYYSSWQLLQFVEVVNMGVTSFMNPFEYNG